VVKRFFFLLNSAFAMAILDLISQVHLPSSVNNGAITVYKISQMKAKYTVTAYSNMH
jgi:hypothetical protein